MEGLIMTAQLLLGLSILVILHEWGHFIAARAFGIKVEKFYLFFDAWGFKLFSKKIGETEYGVGWLPLGGYVKITGMIDESMDKEAMKTPPQPWEFRSKPAWQRLIVMIGGVTVNAILGVVIYSLMIFKNGESYTPIEQVKYGIEALELGKEIGLRTGDKIIAINEKKVNRFEDILNPKALLSNNAVLKVDRNNTIVDISLPADFLDQLRIKGVENFISIRMTFYVENVVPGGNADKAGILNNDVVTAIDGKTIMFFDEFKQILLKNKNKQVVFTINRNSDVKNVTVLIDEDGKVGFQRGTKDIEYAVQHYGFFESFIVGNNKAWEMLYANVKGLGKIIKGELSPKNISSPIGIATFYGGIWNWERFWNITAVLSMALAFMNILPIPALDGGHIVFLIIESVSGRKFSDNFMEKAQIAGMIILLTIMTFAVGNDILKLFN